jgi:hypothetical protein
VCIASDVTTVRVRSTESSSGANAVISSLLPSAWNLAEDRPAGVVHHRE